MIQKLLGNLEKGILFVLSAPAGTGKTTLVRMLSEEFPCIVESISCTTRPPRPNEIEGRDYYFLTSQAFDQKVNKGDFLEFATVFGYKYGTSFESVEHKIRQGCHVFLVIDTQGAMQLLEKQLDAVYIFLSPPSIDVLRERLINRKTDQIEVIEKRLQWAEKEMAMIDRYDYHIINENLELAYAVLRSIVIAEEHTIKRER